MSDNKRKWKELNSKNAEDVFPLILQKDGKIIKSQKELTETLANNFNKKERDERYGERTYSGPAKENT